MSTDATIGPEHAAPPPQNQIGEWTSHPIDLRISIPFVRGRYYLTIVAGRERRPSERRRQARQDYPLLTVGNALFGLGVATMLSMLAVVVLIAHSAIFEY